MPCFGSIAKKSLKFLCGLIVVIFPFEQIPFSPNSKTPLGSNNPLRRSNTAGLHKFALSINNQLPSLRHYNNKWKIDYLLFNIKLMNRPSLIYYQSTQIFHQCLNFL